MTVTNLPALLLASFIFCYSLEYAVDWLFNFIREMAGVD